MAASVTHLPPVTPEPVPAGLLLPLAEYNLSQGMTPDWARSRWPEMADAMERQAPRIASHALRCAEAVRRASL
jgi:hypothetical protein